MEEKSDPVSWELCKENIQPLKQGRNANVLSVALDDNATRKLNSIRHEFEEELRSYSGDDPLDVWYRYVLWVEQNFPKGGKDSNLMKLIQKCVTNIHTNSDLNEKYRNDSRFLNLWIKYASLSPNSVEVYRVLDSKKLCTRLADFYISWSWELERCGNFRRADAIYQKGFEAGATPLDVLQDSHKKFQTRVARATVEGSIPDVETNSTEPQRIALNALKVQGKKNKVANERVGPSVLGSAGRVSQSRPESNAYTPAFSIFTDDSSKSGVNSSDSSSGSLPIKSGVNKENVKEPSQWTKAKVHQKTTGVVPLEDLGLQQKPAFTVHQDENTNQPSQTPSKLPEMSNVLALRKKDDWNVPLFVAEPFDPKVQPQYCKHKVYCGTEEFSFEELRAVLVLRKEKEEREKLQAEEERLAQLQQFQDVIKKQEMMIQQLINDRSNQTPNHQSNKDRSNFHDSWVSMNKSVNVTASVNHSVNVSHFLDESSTRALLQLKPVTLTPLADDALNQPPSASPALVVNDPDASNNSHSNSRGLSLSEPTVNTKLAMNAINDMWSTSLFKNDSSSGVDPSSASGNQENAPFSIFQDDNSKGNGQVAEKGPSSQPFAIFSDSTDNKKPTGGFTIFQDEPKATNSAVSNNPYPEYQDENAPPQGYKQEKKGRALAGVLQPATNVPFCPLEDEEKDDENKKVPEVIGKKDEDIDCNDDFEGISPLNGTAFADFTMKMPNNPEAFAKDAKIASTPAWFLTQASQGASSDNTFGTLMKNGNFFPEDKEMEDGKDQSSGELMPPPSIFRTPATPPETIIKSGLSPILEASREFKSSSSSSPGYSTTSSTLGSSAVGVTHNAGLSTTQPSRLRHASNTQVESASAMEMPGPLPAGDFTKSGYLADNSRGESLAESKQNIMSSQWQAKADEEENTFDPAKAALMLMELDQCDVPPVYKEVKTNNSSKASKINLQENINPFNEELLGKLLSTLNEKVESRGGYVQMSGKAPLLKPNMQLTLNNEMFRIRRLRGEGAYAKVYQAATLDPLNVTIFPAEDDDDDDDDEQQMILKVQKPACQWEFYVCHELRSRLKAQCASKEILDSMMRINRGYFYSNGSILVNEYHKYGSLLDVINGYKLSGQSVPQEIVIVFMIEVLMIVEALHKCQIIHADLKPDNLLVRDMPFINSDASSPEEMFSYSPCALKLIDFGRSIDMKLFPKGTTFTEKVTTEGFTCCEMREGKPWTYETDMYGVAAIAYCFLFGTYMDVKKNSSGKWELKGLKMKRYWKKDLWELLFSTLLNGPTPASVCKLKGELMRTFFEMRMFDNFKNVLPKLKILMAQKK